MSDKDRIRFDADSLVRGAFLVAMEAHKFQHRKVGNEPFIVHPYEVSIILSRANCPDTIVAAGLLHDVVEDTSYTIPALTAALTPYGDVEDVLETVSIVEQMSEIKLGPDGNKLPWMVRKTEHLKRLEAGWFAVWQVKLADCISNARSICRDVDCFGVEVLKNFAATGEQLAWYWEKVGQAASLRVGGPENVKLVAELASYKRVLQRKLG